MSRSLRQLVAVACLVSLTALAPASASAAAGSVSLSVPAAVSVSLLSCAGSALDLGSRDRFSIAVVTATDCTVAYETNSSTGAQLTMVDDDSAAPFLESTTDSFDNLVGPPDVLTNGEFGIALKAVSGGSAADMTVDATPTGADAIWYPIGSTQSNVANLPSPGSATASLRFGADPGVGQSPGSYSGTVTFNVTVNP